MQKIPAAELNHVFCMTLHIGYPIARINLHITGTWIFNFWQLMEKVPAVELIYFAKYCT